MNKLYNSKYIDKMLNIIIISAFFHYIFLQSKVKNRHVFVKIMFGLLGVFGIFKLTDRDFFLPFLGDTVFPQSLIEDKTVYNYDMTVQLSNLPPFTKVIYWASMPSKTDTLQLPWTAYQKYKNSGATTTNKNGVAFLKIKTPQPYKTPFGRVLQPHVHYRYFLTNGMLSKVYTQHI